MQYYSFFRLMQVALGKAEAFPESPSDDEWTQLYRSAVEQSLVGVLYDALQHLPEQQRPPKPLMRKWFSDTNSIERKYVQLTQLTLSVVRRFESDGYRVCLLKGIGNSLHYPNPKVRQCGDVDVWLDASPAECIRYAHRYRPGTKALYHNVEMPVNSQLEVDIHYRPSHLYTPWGNKRAQRLFLQWKEEQFCHSVPMVEGESVAVPTVRFNLVYRLTNPQDVSCFRKASPPAISGSLVRTPRRNATRWSATGDVCATTSTSCRSFLPMPFASPYSGSISGYGGNG